MSVGEAGQPPEVTVVATRGERGAVARFGPLAVSLAILCALATILIFAGLTPVAPTNEVVLGLFAADGVIILVLFALIAWEVTRLLRARRAGAAAARLHIRIVALFAIVAAAPTVVMAIVASLVIERGLNPAFMQDVRGFVQNTAEAARLYRESQCKSLLREADLTASDLDRGLAAFNADRAVFRDYFASRARFLGFSAAAMIRRDGTVVEQPLGPGKTPIVTPEPSDFDDADKGDPLCLVLSEGRSFVALRKLSAYAETYLYVARELDAFAVEFPREAGNVIALYDAFDRHRDNILIAFAVMFLLTAAIMLLSAMWLGLSFANRLVGPIRRLIRATDAVAGGNLYVQVPVKRSEGDFAHLGETFNKMTSELRLQQNGLIEASRQIDARRVFTETVLAGVPAAVVGVDAQGAVTVVNPAARQLLDQSDEALRGRPLVDVAPELAQVLAEAGAGRGRLYHGQTSLTRRGRERIFNVRVAAEQGAAAGGGRVVTLDDITDLVSAQRTAAWADVARRIAHEIKNPLTPIQLSAERLRRKYGKVITTDREVFDQCTDTIVRQVDDIKRMVDEFSSFARMPKARLAEDDLAETVRQALFLMRVGHPSIAFEDEIPAGLRAVFDRRLLSQALTNVIKNGTEGVAAAAENGVGRIRVRLDVADGLARIDVIDDGKGFPAENRQRLLEPYMTTRAEGTGLGLPIVQKILEDHGGGIELLDAADAGFWERGAWVRLWFPIAGPNGAEDGDSPSPAPRTPS
ncbi:MAG: PAS domain-containing sensor histidine kinase [Methylobacteriaceae bacterium]|nr:PAS domain-containing sensor histidine kinase [Methylobacteriaceae bacterium]